MIVVFVHDVHGGTRFVVPGAEDRFMDVSAVHSFPTILRQQRGVNVEDPPAIRGDDPRGDTFHESGEDDHPDVMRAEKLQQRFRVLIFRRELFLTDVKGGYGVCPGDVQNPRT